MTPPIALAGLNAAAVKWLVALLAAVALFLAGYSHGRHVSAGETAQAELRTALAYADEIVARQAVADALAAENAARRTAQDGKDRIIHREIVRYVQVTPDRDRCLLPGSFRLLHDAAATGAPPPEAGAVAAPAPAPVDDATLLATLGDNYAACRLARDQVSAWQRRYQAIEAAP